MSSSAQPRPRRSTAKRTAILDAAETLLAAQSYDTVSIDAIALRAGVSTRTVYDHFGSKEGLLHAVVERVTAILLESVQAALQQALPPGYDPGTGLLDFARRVSAGTFASSHYVRFRQILGSAGSAASGLASLTRTPDDLLQARLQEAIDQGRIAAASARRATQHFIALTFLLAVDLINEPRQVPDSEVDELLTDGVAAFLRAYEARPAG